MATPVGKAATARVHEVVREAYLTDSRVRIAAKTARITAGALTLGLLATVLTWDHRTGLFDLASSSTQVTKPGIGFLIGPVLILSILPRGWGRGPRAIPTDRYRTRLVFVGLLWAGGLATLIGNVASFDDQTIQAGAYIGGVLLSVGLVATLAMWPAGLQIVQVDRRGEVQGPASGERAPQS